MAGEGVWPKVDSDVWYGSDMNSHWGRMLKTAAQGTYLSLYNGETLPELDYQVNSWGGYFSIIDASAEVDTTNQTGYYSEYGGVVLASVLDLFDDASIDATIWSTTGTASESSGYMQIGAGNGTAISDGASGLDLNGADGSIIVDWQAVHDSGDSVSVTSVIQISDGSNHVTLQTVTSKPQNERYITEIFIDDAAATVKYRTKQSKEANWGAWSGTSSLSGLSTNYYLRFSLTNATNSYIRIRDVGYVQGVVSPTFISKTITAGSGSNILYATPTANINSDAGVGAVQFALSANNGSNYENVNEGVTTDFTNAGTQLVMKITGTTTASKPMFVTEYAMYWEE